MCRTLCSDWDTSEGSRHTRTGSRRSSTRGTVGPLRAAAGVGVLGLTSAEDDRSSLSTDDRDTERSVTLTPESLEPSQWSILVGGGATEGCWCCW